MILVLLALHNCIGVAVVKAMTTYDYIVMQREKEEKAAREQEWREHEISEAKCRNTKVGTLTMLNDSLLQATCEMLLVQVSLTSQCLTY